MIGSWAKKREREPRLESKTCAALAAEYRNAMMKNDHLAGRKVLRKARAAGCAWAWKK